MERKSGRPGQKHWIMKDGYGKLKEKSQRHRRKKPLTPKNEKTVKNRDLWKK